MEYCKGKLYVNVEIKGGATHYPSIEARVVSLIEELGMTDQIIISSYELPSIYEVKKLDPTLPTSLRLGGRISWTKEFVRHADAVNLNQHVINRNRVDAIHRHGLLLNVWTVNDPLIMERLARERVDAIFTDRPDILIGVLKALQ